MNQKPIQDIYVGDFETTVYEGQESTEVWASALVKLYTDDVIILHSIEETMQYILSLNSRYMIIYYHNLKFDGSFWLYYLISHNYTHVFNEKTETFLDVAEMPRFSFRYLISNQGQWYSITIKTHRGIIELRDSLKLLPFSIKRIGESFGTKHKKLEMEYIGMRYAGCEITPEEQEYIKNDVLVAKEAIEIMYKDGHRKMTIGSCCLEEFKKIHRAEYSRRYEELFPNLYEIPLDKDTYGFDNVGSYILSSYKGGWCYLVPEKANKVFSKGTTADVNSLYPSVMSGKSGNKYPIGKPTFHTEGKPFIDNPGRYFFIRIEARFKIKPNHLPTIQIKGNPFYKSTEYLTTSDIYNPKTNKYDDYYLDINGNPQMATIKMTLTETDYKMFLQQYDILYMRILSWCDFPVSTSEYLFDEYINKYKEQKMKNKGALREEAKLFLNNLYGKLASTTDSSFKTVKIKDDKLSFNIHIEHKKKPGYIPIGSAITSYARYFTQTAAQANYHGIDKPGFIYADTDSIHCDLAPSELKAIETDDNEFLKWKLESCWDEAIFVRQKTYIEHITHENLKPVDTPYYNIKCAGMNERCKYQLNKSLTHAPVTDEDLAKFNEEQIKFMSTPRKLTDFQVGLQIFGKLRPVQIKGGVVLYEDYYTMH